ncbi:ankyrin repeat domain protein [Nitzschia inconspicua]|uniref:Ankyrin repeat domain protein n=1 Tax=Nitzschia inconspicua TaxID=303405 RepID=A0A9K3LUK5_9STRA|nr:ankyrin repeat domain protein [Nitzschia inconspicua]
MQTVNGCDPVLQSTRHFCCTAIGESPSRNQKRKTIDTVTIEWKPDHAYEMRPMDVPSADSLFCGSRAAPTTKKIQDESHHDDCSTTAVIAQASVAVSPTTYLTMALKNRKIKERIDMFSLEQAIYFEPYKESEIPLPLLQVLRSNDLKRLQLVISSGNYDLEDARNQFGENLVHLACRMGLSTKIVEYLVSERKIPLNVRDKFGRSPLHNACMSPFPDFETIAFVLEEAPKLFLFEDNSGKTPLDGVLPRNFDRWTRFMAEYGLLKRLTSVLEHPEHS